MRYIATLIALVAVASIASAAMTGTFSENTVGSALLTSDTGMFDQTPGSWAVNDLVVTSDLDWTSAILYVSAPGSIFQSPNGTDDGVPPPGGTGTGGPLPPNNTFFTMVPDLEYDTYVCAGSFSVLAAMGTAAGFTTPPLPETTADELSATFFHTGVQTGIVELVRVSIMTSFTGGSWSIEVYDASSEDVPQIVDSGTIVDGVLVPEPATMLIMAIGGIGVLARRRRK